MNQPDRASRVGVGIGRIRSQWHACVAAFGFLTRIPTRWLGASDPTKLADAAPYFPLVGAVVGLSGALVFVGAARVWLPTLGLLVSMAWMIWMTGAFHEDALADAFDGFGGGWNREQILSIMKDSRVGSYALVGVFLVLAAKFAALDAIATGRTDDLRAAALMVGQALVAGHVLGRWSSVALLWRCPYVRTASAAERAPLGTAFDTVTTVQFGAATVIALVLAGAAVGRGVVAISVVALTVSWLAGRYFLGRIGGVTGDALGATNQCVELAVYLALAAHT